MNNKNNKIKKNNLNQNLLNTNKKNTRGQSDALTSKRSWIPKSIESEMKKIEQIVQNSCDTNIINININKADPIFQNQNENTSINNSKNFQN